MTGAVSFAGNSLQTYNRTTGIGIITDNIDMDSLADKALSLFALANANSSVITAENYPQKIIPITGTVVHTSSQNLDALLDTFRSYFLTRNANLDITYNGVTRRFTATASGVTITRSENKKYARFSIQLVCTVPFGADTANTTALTATARTGNYYADVHTFLGTAPYQLPVITVTLTAVSASGVQQMAFSNNDTGQGIIINRSGWTAGDVVVIDCSDPTNQTVTVNGVATDFTGAFPVFTPGSHTMVYSDTFTSRTMNESVVYKARYL
jgi:hypothetical protein